jgi:hypothetical protein
MNICCTLVNGNYFVGAAALINSLVHQGFEGEIHVGYTGQLPDWWPKDRTEIAAGVVLVTILVETHRFLGYQKPFFLSSVVQNHAECSRIFWFDADVVLTAPWIFLQNWVDSGVAICLDIGFTELWPLHPWRIEWRKLIQKANLQEYQHDLRPYPNAGFLGCKAEHFSVLQIWTALIQAFEAEGGNVSSFAMTERWRAVVSDQDLLAATLMCLPHPLVPIGLEGMGFKGMAFPLCHGVESPKPWQCKAFASALSGAGITLYRRHFERFLKIGPLKPMGQTALTRRRIDFIAGTMLARVYKR